MRRHIANRHDSRLGVSILTRRESRVRLGAQTFSSSDAARFQSSPGVRAGCDGEVWMESTHVCIFQSSPGVRAGCDADFSNGLIQSLEFQSSPGVRAGCDIAFWAPGLQLRPFQSSPGVRAGCDVHVDAAAAGFADVSILTRRESRVRRAAHRGAPIPGSRFNPHPA